MHEPMERFRSVFSEPKPVIGMVHLPPLPGAPRYNGAQMADIAEYAISEARKLEETGYSGLIVENFGDAMFYKRARPETIAAMTYVAKALADAVSLPMGICVLQSDAIAAISIAHVVGARFVRVPYYTETYVVDAGLMESCAADALRFRKLLGSDALIFADVHIKHGYPLSQRPIQESAEDAVHRGLADVVIVTGKKTGGPTNVEDVQKVKTQIPQYPVLAGSGISTADAHILLGIADGAIVGTNLKINGDTESPIDLCRAKELMTVIQGIRQQEGDDQR
ncbi:MAG TPA: BtpA/SgcQ family protein [Bacillota bacterium]|nr:BtpA/SgcQ family protein [Bacillota bacterium]